VDSIIFSSSSTSPIINGLSDLMPSILWLITVLQQVT
jgi:hypothetical protein